MSRRVSLAIVALAATAGLALSACHQEPAPAADTAANPVAAAPRDPVDASLLAAAEAFESLTQTAFTVTPTRLEAQTAMAGGVAAGVESRLAAPAQTDLDTQLLRLRTAEAAGDRSEVALSSVEVYRLLISGVRHPGKTPLGVRMLDYAGLRFDAGRHANPARWDDMAAAVGVAREQWRALSPEVKDAALLGQMDKAIADMAATSARQDSKAASRAVQAELALVDQLTAYFNKP